MSIKARRFTAVAVSLVIVATGLAVRAVFEGPFAKYCGTSLYSSFITAFALAWFPRTRPFLAAGASVIFCWAVEFAQLTPLPADLAARIPVSAVVFGTTFNSPDLFWYVVGALAAAGFFTWVDERNSRVRDCDS
ncbi:DUF2809 domain-containing protein [Herbidospora mongoliensis]|uniref:ribosomal maturation YjgA family protein n=1 Tax=Herbidospora mongoliensis TaxID=688067 RepID=UPI000A041463|nr:DUF2809 domain-containing protein [Herbidospora mongoliensis]